MEPMPSAVLTVGGLEVLPWVEKYRPQELDDLIAHEDIMKTIQRFMDTGTLPHLLLYGPPGTGKTSTIMACARKMYGKQFASQCLTLNASDERGINVVRDHIRSFASTQQIFASKQAHPKLVILDEADHMTNQAQFALRRIIEDFHKSTRFCLIGNYAGKIIPALQSRCTRFRFQPLAQAQVCGRVKEICEKENVNIDEGGLEALATIGRGDMRKVLNILQATVMARKDVDRKAVYLTTGTPLQEDIETVYKSLLNDSFAAALKLVDGMRATKGYGLQDLLRGVFDLCVETQFPSAVRCKLMPMLAEIEVRLSKGASERLQAGALVAAFTDAREELRTK
jgi:replication factor C subunit 3/5